VQTCPSQQGETGAGAKEGPQKNAISWDVTHRDLVRTDVSEEHIPSVIRVKIINELGTRLAVRSNPKHAAKKYFIRNVLQLLVIANFPSSPILVRLMMEAVSSLETWFLQKPCGII
jgi:hypothetical protein